MSQHSEVKQANKPAETVSVPLGARISTVLVCACATFHYWQRGCHLPASLGRTPLRLLTAS